MRLEPFTLTGTHVQLEPLSREHAVGLTTAADRDRSTFGFTNVPANLAAMEHYIEGLLHDAEHDTAVPFMQRRVADGEPVGCTRFLNVIWWAGFDRPTEVEIGGTWLAADAQRSAMNTEAKLLLLTQAFEGWDVHRVAICTDENNARSRTAIERLGARFEGILRNHRATMGHLTTPGLPRNTASYSILPFEWPSVKARLQERLDAR